MATFASFAQQQNINQGSSTLEKKEIRRIGLQAGVNLTQMAFMQITDLSMYPDLVLYPRFNVGFYSETGNTEYFVTQIGMFYSGAGYKTKEITTSLEYIKVPLLLNFRSNIAGPVSFMIGAGPYAAFAFHGAMKYDNIIDQNILSWSNSNKEKNNPYNYIDAGVIFSGSVEILLNNSNIIKVGASYDFGVLAISNEYMTNDDVLYDEQAKNRILSINLAYVIDLKDRD